MLERLHTLKNEQQEEQRQQALDVPLRPFANIGKEKSLNNTENVLPARDAHGDTGGAASTAGLSETLTLLLITDDLLDHLSAC